MESNEGKTWVHEVLQNVRPSVYIPNCVSGIQHYCFEIFKIPRLYSLLAIHLKINYSDRRSQGVLLRFSGEIPSSINTGARRIMRRPATRHIKQDSSNGCGGFKEGNKKPFPYSRGLPEIENEEKKETASLSGTCIRNVMRIRIKTEKI